MRRQKMKKRTKSIIYNYDDSSSNNVTQREYADVPMVNVNNNNTNKEKKSDSNNNNNNCLIF